MPQKCRVKSSHSYFQNRPISSEVGHYPSLGYWPERATRKSKTVQCFYAQSGVCSFRGIPVISVFAVSLPIILAVMGVIVALKPPSTAMLWVWVVAFIIVGLIAIVVSVIDRRNADDAIKGLKDSIDKMTKPVSESIRPARDPDALYQNGNVVGKVAGARITLNDSKVYFEQIEDAGNLDTKRTFEYRDYVLRFIRADSFIGLLVQAPGGVKNSVYQRVVSEIVDRAH
jgi:hypothetical protein